MIVLHCGKPRFLSLPVALPICRSKSAKFQLCITARSIIIFRRTALPYLFFVFVFFSVSIKYGVRTADHGLRTGYKARTRNKIWNTD